MKKIGITFLSAILGITTAFAAELISKETAQEIALRHAGVDPSQATVTKIKLSNDNDAKYEVEFKANGIEYEYDINAVTGEAIEYSRERKADTLGSAINDIQNDLTNATVPTKDTAEKALTTTINQPTVVVTPTPKLSAVNDTNLLSAEQAKKIVLDKLPGATKQQIIEFELDHDDGRALYEGKVIQDTKKYEFTIDAQNGHLIKWELD